MTSSQGPLGLFGIWVKFLNIGTVILSTLLYTKINDVYFPQEAKCSSRPLYFSRTAQCSTEQVSVGNLIQNSNVALTQSPNVVFKNIDIQFPYSYSKHGKDLQSSNCAILFNEFTCRGWLGCTEILKFLRVDSSKKKKKVLVG